MQEEAGVGTNHANCREKADLASRYAIIENSRFPRNIDIPRNIRAKLGGSPEY